MNTFKLTFDISQEHLVKPTDFVTVNKNLNTVLDISIEDFSKAVTYPNGYSFTCGTFKNNKRKNANWLQQSVFALDFDDGLTPNEALEISKSYGITPNVIYTSFSDSPQLRKFRVLFFLDKVITDKAEAKFIILNLMNMYNGKADKACKDYARMFFGGKECLHLDTNVINYDKFIEVLNTIQVANDSMKTRKVKYTPNSKFDNSISDRTDYNGQYNDGKLIKDFDFELASKKVKIFNDFMNGKWLTHLELFGIATNLVHIMGGLKLMKAKMIEANDKGIAKYTENNFGILPYVNKIKYTPQRLENFSPYETDYDYINIINSVRTIRGTIVETEQRNYLSLDAAQRKLQLSFDNIANVKEGIFLFKLPTGLGKTKALERMKNVTIALPTHKLKEEVSDRMKVPHKVTPEIPTFDDISINDLLEFYYGTGLTSKAIALLKSVAHNETKEYSYNDIEKAITYIQANNQCYATQDTVITTHQKALYSTFRNDTLIFDEDPIQSILSLKSITIGDLIELEGVCDNKQELSQIINHLRNLLTPNVITETPLFAIDIDDLAKSIVRTTIDSNLIDFLNSDYIVKDGNNSNVIHYISKNDLPKNKKIMILSATASEYLYRQMYGDDLTVIDMLDVEQVGQVIQYTSYSFSRQSLNKQSAKMKELLEPSKDLPTITFMQHKNKFNNAVDEMHFGNCAGYDFLKGLDISVVGTPHLSNTVYVLYAKVLGLEVKPKDMTMNYQMTEYNGFKFKFMTYDNEYLRNIQLSLIESDLVQAIGRNRTLREDCTTYVYSNFPLRQSTQFIF